MKNLALVIGMCLCASVLSYAQDGTKKETPTKTKEIKKRPIKSEKKKQAPVEKKIIN